MATSVTKTDFTLHQCLPVAGGNIYANMFKYTFVFLRTCTLFTNTWTTRDFSGVTFHTKRGLQTLRILDAIKNHPERFCDVITNENLKALNAATADTLFSIELAEVGSKEEQNRSYLLLTSKTAKVSCETIPILIFYFL